MIGIYPAGSAQINVLMTPFYRKYYLCASVRCKQPSNPLVSFRALISSLSCAGCWSVRFVPIRFWWMGHGWVVRHTAHISGWRICVSRVGGLRFPASIQHKKQFGHNWHLICCLFTETCSQVSFKKNIEKRMNKLSYNFHDSSDMTQRTKWNCYGWYF